VISFLKSIQNECRCGAIAKYDQTLIKYDVINDIFIYYMYIIYITYLYIFISY